MFNNDVSFLTSWHIIRRFHRAGMPACVTHRPATLERDALWIGSRNKLWRGSYKMGEVCGSLKVPGLSWSSRSQLGFRGMETVTRAVTYMLWNWSSCLETVPCNMLPAFFPSSFKPAAHGALYCYPYVVASYSIHSTKGSTADLRILQRFRTTSWHGFATNNVQFLYSLYAGGPIVDHSSALAGSSASEASSVWHAVERPKGSIWRAQFHLSAFFATSIEDRRTISSLRGPLSTFRIGLAL